MRTSPTRKMPKEIHEQHHEPLDKVVTNMNAQMEELHQPELFDPEFGTPSKFLVRSEGPETSEEAADAIESETSRLEKAVLDVIKGYGDDGCISDEVLHHFPSLAYSSVTARYSALKRKGYIRIDGKRPGNSGRNQGVMKVC